MSDSFEEQEKRNKKKEKKRRNKKFPYKKLGKYRCANVHSDKSSFGHTLS